jgi:hypothetical protein
MCSCLTLQNTRYLHVVDTCNHQVVTLNLDTGILTVAAGNGTTWLQRPARPCPANPSATAVQLNNPRHVAVHPEGHLYIADTGNDCIRAKHATQGFIVTVAGLGMPGWNGATMPATYAAISGPAQMTFYNGSLFFTDAQQAVRKVAPAPSPPAPRYMRGLYKMRGRKLHQLPMPESPFGQPGTISTLAGGHGSGITFNQLHGLIIDPRTGELIIADAGANLIRRILLEPFPMGTTSLSQDGQNCTQNAGCQSGRCDPVRQRCVAAHCFNSIKDADELQADCGGADCVACAPGGWGGRCPPGGWYT